MTARAHLRSATIAFCLLWSIACPAAAAAEYKRVILLHSFGQHFTPWSVYGEETRAALGRQSPWPLDVVDHALVTARSDDVLAEEAFIRYLVSLYARAPPDLIMTLGAPAATFVQRHRQRLFPKTPLLLAAVSVARTPTLDLGPNDAVVAVRSDLPGFLDNMLRVLPDTKTVAVVIGSSPLEKGLLEGMREQVKAFDGRVAFTWYDELPFDEILKRAAALPPHTSILWMTMNVDAAGVAHEGYTAFNKLRAVANAPIFSYQGAFFGRGIVGGPMFSVRAQSQQTVAAAIRLLGGDKPAELKVLPIGFSEPKFDARELKRWGIGESLLPPGSETQFRETGVWAEYRLQILAGCMTLIVQACLILWLIYEHRRRGVAEVQSRNAMTELTHMNRIATAGELSASIAHEVNQPLSGITTRASAALRWLSAETPDLDKVRSALKQIMGAGERAGDIVGSVRAMFRKEDAAWIDVDTNKLIRMVLAIVRVELKNHYVELRPQLAVSLPKIKGDPVQLQQVILNLVMNATEAMHSVEPRVLRIGSKLINAHAVRVTIEDTGIGIDPENLDRVFETLFTTKPLGMGMGLSICRSIIVNHGGRIWVSHGTEKGSMFEFELPIAEAASPKVERKVHAPAK
jgi:signal transduction histidine kinase